MANITRRNCIQGSFAALAGAGSAHAVRTRQPGKAGIKLALIQSPTPEERKINLGIQYGVKHAIVTVASALTQVPRSEYLPALAKIKADFDARGVDIAGVESHPVAAEKIKLGVAGRDEEIENYIAAIQALGKVGIPVLCYNFMAGLGWYRTKVDVAERGGALTSEFDLDAAEQQGPTKWGEISEQKLWSNMEYFLKAVIPAAEKAGVKMALHPDDPPLPRLRGISRILVNAKNFRRVLNMIPSPANGITFCQANFVAMGENIEELAKEWCREKKIFFVHFRDIEGKGKRFRETFHDNGPTDMPRMLQVYHEGGFDGPIRPDHAPTMYGEANDRPGYAIQGKLFAIAYMKGVMDGMKIPYA